MSARSSRARLPSLRSIEAREAQIASASMPPPPPRKRTTGKAAASAAPAKRANVSGRGGVAAARAKGKGKAVEGDQDLQDDNLYCVCLAKDDKVSPMIECSYCNNWFHFRCINLSEEEAQAIESYCCDICEQMGYGTTVYADTAAAKEDAGDDYMSESEEQDDSEDEDFGGRDRSPPVTASPKKGRKRRRVERYESDGDTEDDDSDDEKPRIKTERSKARRVSGRAGASQSMSPPPGRMRQGNRRTSSSMQLKAELYSASNDKTRKHCISQLNVIFKSIFEASQEDDETATMYADKFATSVEEELFAGFAEPDKDGIPAPKVKYIGKFRQLHYNLKTNADFRSRIADNEFTAHEIVHITNEDLLTPELRKMAESVRANSLKQSVREVMQAPTAKRTHKGEEEIENLAVKEAALAEREAAAREAAANAGRERRASASGTPDAARERSETGVSDMPAIADSPAVPQEGGSENEEAFPDWHTSNRRSRSPSNAQRVSISADDLGGFDDGNTPARERSESAAGFAADGASPPSSSRQAAKPLKSRASFDMASVWGNVKSESPAAASVPADGEAKTEAKEEAQPQDSQPEEYDPFKTTDADAGDLDDILGDGPSSKPSQAAAPSNQRTIADLARTWTGDVIVPEEGGFPGFGVQVGGRPFDENEAGVWRSILPKGLMQTEGRLPTPVANKYLVECSFAASRELVAVALLPELTGPTPEAPMRPSREKTLAKHQRLIDVFTKRDRVGAVAMPRELRKLVKDLYLIPLKRGAQLPEYIELLDDHIIDERVPRDSDLLLAVAVMQKGALPATGTPLSSRMKGPETTTAVTSSSAPAAPGVSHATPEPSTGPRVEADSVRRLCQLGDASALSALFSNADIVRDKVITDPVALQALLANANLLSALATSPGTADLLRSLTDVSQAMPDVSVPTSQPAHSHSMDWQASAQQQSWPQYGGGGGDSTNAWWGGQR